MKKLMHLVMVAALLGLASCTTEEATQMKDAFVEFFGVTPFQYANSLGVMAYTFGT